MKKIAYGVILGFLFFMLLAGCKDDTGKQTAAGTSAPKRDDINLCLEGVVSTLDPYATSLTVDIKLFRQIYESFYYIDDFNQPHPRLALRHEISPDGMVYTFYMRRDAFFHNGDPVSADDAVFSFRKALSSGVMAPYVNVVSRVDKVDDYTVAITLKQPYTPFLANTMQVCIISEKAYTGAGSSFGASVTGAGTGPYMVTSFDGNTRIELAAFEKYYLGAPPIKKVNFLPIADTSTALIAFEKGELDFYEIPVANWAEISGSGKYTCELNPTSGISYMLMNPAEGVLANQDLRYAIQYAVNRDAINIIAYEGMAEPAYSMMHPKYIFGQPENGFKFSYDPVKAKEYLVKAGYPNGVDIGTIQCTAATWYPKIAQTLQSQLAEVGIACKLEIGQSSQLVSGWRAGQFDMMISGFNAVLDYDYFTRYTSPAISTSFLKYQNTQYDAQWVVEMYNKGAAELDPAKRLAIYGELDDFIARTACYVPIFYRTVPYAWNPNLNVKLALNYYYVKDFSWK